MFSEKEFSDRQQTVNIFTGASFTKKLNTGYTCFGSVSIYGDNTQHVDLSDYQISIDSSKYGEIAAIRLGVLQALYYKKMNPLVKKINIFSNSEICIKGLRNYCFKWMNYITLYKTIQPLETHIEDWISNQDVFLCIIRTIIDNDLPISFYHCSGNSSECKKNSAIVKRIKNTFMKMNGFHVPESTIQTIVYMKSKVDEESRRLLVNSNLSYSDLLGKVSYKFILSS